MTKQKMYCVHVYPKMRDYETVRATSAKAAERQVLGNDPYAYDEIDRVEVMRECECGTDNDLSNKNCEQCNKAL